jgi:hypothetical protein
MSQLLRTPAASSPQRGDRLLSSFQIVRSPSYRQGRPYQQTKLLAFDGPPLDALPARLKDHRNWNGHSYAESHVEEWVSRHPAALYPSQAVHVLASQNYARLGEKIDLLLLDRSWQFHTLELKAERVAGNRGVVPDQIQGQMTRYENFLRSELPHFPSSLSGYYAQFTGEFLGSALGLIESLRQEFGEAFLCSRTEPLVLCRTFLTEGYDDYAVDYFRARQRQGDGPIRLLYYRFFPAADDHRIEFWEVPLCDDDGTTTGTLSLGVEEPAAPPDAGLVPSQRLLQRAEDTQSTASDAMDGQPPEYRQASAYGPPSSGGPAGLDAATYLFERQVLWARRLGVALQGSAGERGRPAYTPTLEENLFEPLTEEARREYEQGQGQELRQNMRAVHSSSALACNVFHYWKSRGQPAAIAAACGLPAGDVASIRFETQHPIADKLNRDVFPYDPNPDVEFVYAPDQRVKAAAVECKFGEPYSTRGHAGIKRAYLVQPNLWDGLSHCRDLATRLSPDDAEFKYLHAAQLLKHLLGLKNAYGLGGCILVYLWYDVPGGEGWHHRQEVERFGSLVRQDGIDFRAITYQEVLLHLARHHRDGNAGYVDYLVERYL